jgi:hypothetical protein
VIAYQHDRTRKFYCRVDHIEHDPPLEYGHNRITKQDFRNLEREGEIRPPVNCARRDCGRRLYGGKRLVLKTGPGELVEPYVVWVEELWVDGVNPIRDASFITADEVAEHLIRNHGVRPEVARQKASEMQPSRRVVIEPREDGQSGRGRA